MAALISSVSRELVLFTEWRSLLLLRSCNSVVINSRRFIRGLRRRPVAVLYPGDERETLIKAPDQSKQHKHDPETLKKHPNKTDGRTSKEKTSSDTLRQTGLKRSSGNLPGVAVESCGVREQLDGLRFDRALPGDKRLAWVSHIHPCTLPIATLSLGTWDTDLVHSQLLEDKRCKFIDKGRRSESVIRINGRKAS